MTDPSVGVLLTTSEVSRIFRVSECTVHRWVQVGRLECGLTPGGHHRYSSVTVRDVLIRQGMTEQEADNIIAHVIPCHVIAPPAPLTSGDVDDVV